MGELGEGATRGALAADVLDDDQIAVRCEPVRCLIPRRLDLRTGLAVLRPHQDHRHRIGGLRAVDVGPQHRTVAHARGHVGLLLHCTRAATGTGGPGRGLLTSRVTGDRRIRPASARALRRRRRRGGRCVPAPQSESATPPRRPLPDGLRLRSPRRGAFGFLRPPSASASSVPRSGRRSRRLTASSAAGSSASAVSASTLRRRLVSSTPAFCYRTASSASSVSGVSGASAAGAATRRRTPGRTPAR